MITVIGATGNVGRTIVALLLDKGFTKLRVIASQSGRAFSVAGQDFITEAATDFTSGICIFATEAEVSAQYAPEALEAGAYVIDASSHYRLQPDVPLIVPPVNAHLIVPEQRLYAHANCVASPIAVVLYPLHQAFGVTRVNAVTYQSTSGAGKKAMDACLDETRAAVIPANAGIQSSPFPRPIAFNVIPQIGVMRADGLTSEEFKIAQEIKKVISKDILITATAVRVPVMIGHCVALSLTFANTVSLSDITDVLRHAPHVQITDYKTPREVVGSDDVFVGRVRLDETGLHLWLCSDNLRRGAATDAVEIFSKLLTFIPSYST